MSNAQRLRAVTALVTLGLAQACRPFQSPERHARLQSGLARVWPALSESSLTVRTVLAKDTIGVGERAQLLYFVINGGSPKPFWNDPGLSWFLVEAEEGPPLTPRSAGARTESFGPQVRLMIPARSMLVRLVDLSCIVAPYGQQVAGACDYGWNFSRPGRYRVIASYHGTQVQNPGQPNVLADTVTLIVR